jgi:hypothetical protein
MINLFSKTKNINKILTGYYKQYDNVKSGVISYYENKENLEYEHGQRLFGDIKSVLETTLNDGIEDIKGNYINIYENEFKYLMLKNDGSLDKWIKNSGLFSIPKFASEEFIELNYDFINEKSSVPLLNENILDLMEIHPVINEVKKCQKIRQQYFTQVDILNTLGNTKLRSNLEKANEKSLSILAEKQKYAEKFIFEFNSFIHQHLVFKTYDLEINLLDPRFNEKDLTEALMFFNIVLFFIENKTLGIQQSSKVFAKEEIFKNIGFNKEKWIPLFKQFGLEII